MKRLLFIFALVCCWALPLRAQVPVVLAPNAKPQFLNNSGVPLAAGCIFTFAAGTTTPLASYTDSTGTVQNPNPIILDAGGFPPTTTGIWLSSAAYKLQAKSAGGSNCSTGSTIWTIDNVNNGGVPLTNFANVFTVLQTFNAGLTSAGPNTLNGSNAMGKWNSIFTVDGTQFTTCDLAQTAAIAQAGSGTALVIVPSTSASVCSADNVKAQVWYFNGQTDPSVRSGVSWNNTSATPIHSYVRFQDNDPSPAGSSVGAYFVHRFSGAMPTANAMDAISPEVQTTGVITSWGATAALQASENVCTVASTGSTISQVFCTVSYMRGAALSTTNVTNAFGFYAPTMVNSGTGVWTNIYGAVFDVQNAGIGNNLSWWAKGATETDGQASFLCSSTLPCISLRADTISNNNAMEIQDTHAGGHNWWLGEQNNVTVFSLVDRTQTNRPSWGFQVTGSTAAEGRFVHANTGNRTYAFPDASANIAYTAVLHTAYTNATTTFSNLSDGTRAASFAVAANTDYTVSCKLLFQGSVTTAGPKVQVTGPAAPTAVMLAVDGSTGAAAFADAGATAFSTPVTAFGTLGAGTTNFTLHIEVGVSNGANAGTVAVQLAANGAGTLTVQPGSYCRIQ